MTLLDLFMVIGVPFIFAFGAYKGLKDKDMSYAGKGARIFVAFAIGQILAFAFGMWTCSKWRCLIYIFTVSPTSPVTFLLFGVFKSTANSLQPLVRYSIGVVIKIFVSALIGAGFGWLIGKFEEAEAS